MIYFYICSLLSLQIFFSQTYLHKIRKRLTPENLNMFVLNLSSNYYQMKTTVKNVQMWLKSEDKNQKIKM